MGPSSQLTPVRLGQTDLTVTRYCQGTAFRHLERNAHDPRAERVLRHCLDAGVNFFDSAQEYGWAGLKLPADVRGKLDAASERYSERLEQEHRQVGDETG